MIRFDLKKTQSMFFDRPKVMAQVDRTTRRVLSKFGAYVMTRARTSIRRTPKGKAVKKDGSPRKRQASRVSKPGNPPFSHTDLLKRLIYFSFDPNRRSVVIGPERLNQRGGRAPALLERGGTTTIRGRRGSRTARYKARPYMGPAFEKELPKLPAMWRNSVR